MQPSSSHAIESDGDDLVWRTVKEVRDEVGTEIYDDRLRKMFTLFDKNVDPNEQFKNGNEVWDRFQKIFTRIRSFLSYAPARKAYFKNELKEMLNDGIQYLELRGGLSKVCIFLLLLSHSYIHSFLSILFLSTK